MRCGGSCGWSRRFASDAPAEELLFNNMEPAAFGKYLALPVLLFPFGLGLISAAWYLALGDDAFGDQLFRGPQIVDVRIGEGQSVRFADGRRCLGRRRLGAEEAMYGAARQPQRRGKAAGQMNSADQAVERGARTLGTQLGERVGMLGAIALMLYQHEGRA